MESASVVETMELGTGEARADYPEFISPTAELDLHVGALLKLFKDEIHLLSISDLVHLTNLDTTWEMHLR
jgi:hypothetical protein